MVGRVGRGLRPVPLPHTEEAVAQIDGRTVASMRRALRVFEQAESRTAQYEGKMYTEIAVRRIASRGDDWAVKTVAQWDAKDRSKRFTPYMPDGSVATDVKDIAAIMKTDTKSAALHVLEHADIVPESLLEEAAHIKVVGIGILSEDIPLRPACKKRGKRRCHEIIERAGAIANRRRKKR